MDDTKRLRDRDLETRAEIHDLVIHFYREVALDDLLGPVFGEVAEVDWAVHIPRLIDYWSQVLLGEPGYDGAILAAHRYVHGLEPLRPELFERWYAPPRRTGRLMLCALAAVTGALGVAGCSTISASPWDGQPWTNTHPEPCRKYAPVTLDWVRAHPNHPCAQLTPPEPQPVQLGPACSLVKGEPLRCSTP